MWCAIINPRKILSNMGCATINPRNFLYIAFGCAKINPRNFLSAQNFVQIRYTVQVTFKTQFKHTPISLRKHLVEWYEISGSKYHEREIKYFIKPYSSNLMRVETVLINLFCTNYSHRILIYQILLYTSAVKSYSFDKLVLN